MKKLYLLLSVLIIIASVKNAEAQTGQTKKRTTQVKKVSRTNVVYRKPTTKVVAVRTLPTNRSVVKHNGQTYQYVNNRFYRYNGGRYIQVRPVVGLRIRTLPVGYRTVVFSNRNYYVHEGVYYSQTANEYEVVEPEVGTLVYELPSDYEKVEVDGMTLYESNSVLYEKVQVDGTRAYEIVGIIGD